MNIERFERWVASDLPDEEEARRARLLNVWMVAFIVSLALFSLVGLVVWAASLFRSGGWLVLFSVVGLGLAWLIYAINRSGRLVLAARTLSMSLSVAIILMLLMFGHRGGAPMFIPVVILGAAVLLRRRAALTFAAALGLIYLLVAWAEVSGRWDPWLLPSEEPFPADLLISGRVFGVLLMAILAWLSAGSLEDVLFVAHQNLRQTRQRGAELEQMRAGLEEQVRVRTSELETALARVRQSEEQQRNLLDAVRRQAFPVIPILGQVVAMPVVGVLDAARADQLLVSLLEGLQQYDARFALLDVTGAPVTDEEAARVLIRAVTGARMVGAECVLVGVNPNVAARLVDLGVDLSELVSRVDMEAGVRYALQRMHYRLVRETI